MQAGAQLQAAIEVMQSSKSAGAALSDWGRSHRFAGSKDRAAIGNLVFDALRSRASSGYLLGADDARAVLLGALRRRGLTPEAIAALCSGPHAPAALSAIEQARLALEPAETLAAAPPHIQADIPEWLWPSLSSVFGARTVHQGQALAARASLDLRANRLKTNAASLRAQLAEWGAAACAFAPDALRIEPAAHGRTPNFSAHPLFLAGHFEVQDQASQMAALLTGARPGMHVLDYCAGAGGKSLALAAMLGNQGELIAYDIDAGQQEQIFARIARAGASCIRVIRAGDQQQLQAMPADFDLVLVDAPCTGSGTWRRTPDAKWRLQPQHLQARTRQQAQVLAHAARWVKPGGRLVYLTCSLLPEENTLQVAQFLSAHAEFSVRPWKEMWKETWPEKSPMPTSADGAEDGLLLTPADHRTDGFFIAIMQRAP
jgi:16S rRNA (cytosine967-C5)-methyltransferase